MNRPTLMVDDQLEGVTRNAEGVEAQREALKLEGRRRRLVLGIDGDDYPFYDHTIAVTRCGRIVSIGGQSELCARRPECPVTQVVEPIWLVTFMQHDLGCFDDETCRLERSKIRLDRECYPPLRIKFHLSAQNGS